PAIHGDMVDPDAPFGEQLLDVAVGEAKAQVRVDRDDNHIGWKPEASKVRSWNRSRARTARSHAASLAAPQRSQRMQQRGTTPFPWAAATAGARPPSVLRH